MSLLLVFGSRTKAATVVARAHTNAAQSFPIKETIPPALAIVLVTHCDYRSLSTALGLVGCCVDSVLIVTSGALLHYLTNNRLSAVKCCLW